MMKPNEKEIRKLLASRARIEVTQRFITKVLGFDDMRDFVKSIGDWGYCTDFTYRDYQTERWQPFLRRYLKEEVLGDDD